MNKRQKTVVLVGLALMVLMGLFPPWIHSFVLREDKQQPIHFERFAGYGSLFNPPEPAGEGQSVAEFIKDISRSSVRGFWITESYSVKHFGPLVLIL